MLKKLTYHTAIVLCTLYLVVLCYGADAQIAINFFGSGTPFTIVAKSNVEYIDVQTRIRYRQIAIPQGTNWVVVAQNA